MSIKISKDIMEEVYIYDTIRTPFGKGNKEGALFEVRPIDLLSKCLKALQKRNKLDTTLVEDFLLACMIPIGGQADNIAKSALLYADWSASIPGLQLNRFQAAGLAAIELAMAKIKAGMAGLVIAGGLESRSRIHREKNRGAISNDPNVLHKIGSIPSGIAADLIATMEQFSRIELDEYAIKSIQKAITAQSKHYFEKSIIAIFDQNEIPILQNDETIDSSITIESLASQQSKFPQLSRNGFDVIALKKYPLVEQILPLHSTGNIANPADSAALTLLGNADQAQKTGLRPRAKIIDVVTTSTELTITHLGAIEATKQILKKTNLNPQDIDLWYINEAFAAPALLFQKTFDLSEEQLNPCGGNIAFGDPLGANGIILFGMLLGELERQNLKRGLIALSGEGGIGVSLILEVL